MNTVDLLPKRLLVGQRDFSNRFPIVFGNTSYMLYQSLQVGPLSLLSDSPTDEVELKIVWNSDYSINSLCCLNAYVGLLLTSIQHAHLFTFYPSGIGSISILILACS